MLIDVYKSRKSFMLNVVSPWAGCTGAIIAAQTFSGMLPRLVISGSLTLPMVEFFLGIWIIPGLLIGVLYALFLWCIYYPFTIRRYYMDNESFYKEISLLADEHGIEWTTKHSTAKFLWNDLQSFKKTSKYLVINASKNLYFIIPKKEIEDNSAKILTNLLERKLKNA